MEVREDIAVGRDDEARTGRGRGRLIAPEVRRGDGRSDADGGVYVLCVDLRRSHKLGGVYLSDVNGLSFALTLVHHGGRSLPVLRRYRRAQIAAADARSHAEDGAAEHKRDDSAAAAG